MTLAATTLTNGDRNVGRAVRPPPARALWLYILLVIVAFLYGSARVDAAQAPEKGGAATNTSWSFVVTGDSRNCGNLVMPAIAQAARASGAKFFWHLGDFRALAFIDEDFSDNPANPPTLADYDKAAWSNFIDKQLRPFGTMAVYLTIGNHELIGHTRENYLAAFEKWLSAPVISRQRLSDDSADTSSKAYYHWSEQGIDFITLDNASDDRFEEAQVLWFEKLLERDEHDGAVRSIVVGMHKALPGSISEAHSMSESGLDQPIQSGRQIYRDLLRAQNEFHKKVYVLASHSHFYMEGIFNTEAWKDNVLPGWIVGTGGAQLYDLPPDAHRAKQALQGVYGYMLATVNSDAPAGRVPDGTIQFEFKLIGKSDVNAAVAKKFSPKLVDFCFDSNVRKLN